MMILLLLVSQAFAKENWFCTTESSQMQGNQVLACGIGEAQNESQARALAFDNAKEEFSRLCNSSMDCGKRKYKIDPKRTTCEEYRDGYKCYRLLAYTIETDRLDIEGKPKFKVSPMTEYYMAISRRSYKTAAGH